MLPYVVGCRFRFESSAGLSPSVLSERQPCAGVLRWKRRDPVEHRYVLAWNRYVPLSLEVLKLLNLVCVSVIRPACAPLEAAGAHSSS